MREAVLGQTAVRAAILAEALAGTVAELRLIDPGDMINYIRRGRWAEIADLVQSSSELFFTDRALSFACMADFAMDWTRPLSISLDLEFQHEDVSAFFTLHLGCDEDLVDLKTTWFASTPSDEATATRRFAQAVASARLPPCAT